MRRENRRARGRAISGALVLWALAASGLAQDVIIRPREISDVLLNPGMGFTTQQRFNGDRVDPPGWIEGRIESQDVHGNYKNENYPQTTLAYVRLYWSTLEPGPEIYDWQVIDKALATARERGQSLIFRVMPSGETEADAAARFSWYRRNIPGDAADVPSWYRALVGPWHKLGNRKWLVDPEDPRYLKYFGGLIRALGKRYDGHPDLESVDVALVGMAGEDAGVDDLKITTRHALLDCYLESFKKTPLLIQLDDQEVNKYSHAFRPVGWRTDCLGDMGFFEPNWSHMLDLYPQMLSQSGLQDDWKQAPVAFEICGIMQDWKERGWDIDYIIDQSLKWHISSLNAKSAAVPKEWEPQVNRWLKSMGYRFVLRKFTYPQAVSSNGKLAFTSWWENKGVAPCYKKYSLALRLKNDRRTELFLTDANITTWLPGDNVYDDAVFLPVDMPVGDYEISLALVDPSSRQPKVKLAIEGLEEDGWYRLGRIKVRE